tara:strand:+ start:184 stop:366 length:183 start_codon:yes stop_codon:yes gene_type:complete
VVHVDNTEKMKEMEKQLEKEKKAIKKKFESETKKIMQQTELDEDAKKKLMDDLKVREEAQ